MNAASEAGGQAGGVWGQLITLLLGGSGVALISTAVWAWNTLRTGARARAREVLQDVETARDEAEDRARVRTADAVFWQGVAGSYAYQLRALCGREPEPANPVPPSVTGLPERRGTRSGWGQGRRQQGRVRRDDAAAGELWIDEEDR